MDGLWQCLWQSSRAAEQQCNEAAEELVLPIRTNDVSQSADFPKVSKKDERLFFIFNMISTSLF